MSTVEFQKVEAISEGGLTLALHGINDLTIVHKVNGYFHQKIPYE